MGALSIVLNNWRIDMVRYIYILSFIFVSVLYTQSKGGFWSFSANGDDNADWDSVNNAGTLINSAHFSSENGISGSYLDLETPGGYDYFLVEDDPDLDFNSENIGISLWIYPKIINNVHFLVTKGDQFISPKTTNYALRIQTTKKIEFLIRDANDQAHYVSSNFTIETGQWQFIAAYYDYNSQVVHFWNENTTNPTESIVFDKVPLMNDDPLAIGAWYRSDTQKPSIKDFEGWIDEVRISSRQEDLFPNNLRVKDEKGLNKHTNFSIYPNPISKNTYNANVSFKVEFLPNEKYKIKIYSILGKEIYSRTFNADEKTAPFHLPIKDLKTGMYFVSIINQHRTQTTKLLILE